MQRLQTLILVFRVALVFAFPGVLSGCSDGGSSGFSVKPPPSEALAISSPVRLAANNATTFLVSDFNSGKILVIDKTSLQPTTGFRVSDKPTGLEFSGGKYFVASLANGSVDVLNARGKLLYRLGDGAGTFAQVNDLAVDAGRDRVYVLDTVAARIRVFSMDGTAEGADIGTGLLVRPTALTLDPASGNLLVSDFGTPGQAKIWIFNPAGVQIDSITGQFSTPQGLFVDAAGYLFLVDARSGEVQIFNQTTKAKVKTLGGLGTGPGELFYPLDVLVDESTRDVFVADNRNGRITVFQGGGVVP